MTKNIDITKKISAVILLMLLLLPTFSSIAHSFGDHDHPVCKEVKTHLHELESECAVCDFHFEAFNFTPLQNVTDYSTTYFLNHISHYDSITTLNTYYNYTLRGPPQIQHDC